MSEAIGIISYLPDDPIVRNERKKRLSSLFSSIDELFGDIPILVIAQNWDKSVKAPHGAVVWDYPTKLGIVGARNELRNRFVNSGHDWLIMMDDDCVLKHDGRGASEYLKAIRSRKEPGFGEANGTCLKLFCIHRDVISKQGFPELTPENDGVFEDWVFVSSLRKRFPELKFSVGGLGIWDESVGTGDSYSTWSSGKSPSEMLRRTKEIIADVH